MGPVNWLAVVLSALLAVAIGAVWYGPLFGARSAQRTGSREGQRGAVDHIVSLALLLISASLIGHNFARTGAETLAAKPWLYPMMSGGLALTIIAPALLISLRRVGLPLRAALIEAGYWLVAYLAMGAVFWALS